MKRLAYILLFLTPLLANAQRVKFRDLVPLLSTYSPERQKNELKEYLAADLDHPNTNFRLALLYEANYKNADPLTDYAFAMANAEQATNRYIKSKQLVDEREVNRNEEYYAPIFKAFDAKGNPAIQFPRVSAKITGGYDSAILFKAKMPSIYKAFTKSVNFYDQSVRLFAGITEEFSTIEDLYLMHNELIDIRLSKIKTNYDSSIVYLNKYLDLIKDYPIKGHRPSYKVRPIVTYRLDGLLTNINFLTDQIQLWDYSTWVNQVKSKIVGDVSDFRKKIASTNQKMDENLSKIGSSFANFPAPIKVDKQLTFNLNNLDRQSMILSLLDYKAYKQETEIQWKSKSLDTLPTSRNAEVFSQLIYSNRKADTLVKEFKLRVSDAKAKKHRDFVTKTFGGVPGLEKYAETEQKIINDSYAEFGVQLRNNILGLNTADNSYTNKEGFLKFGRYTIPLLIQPPTPEALDLGVLFTKFNRKNPDGSAYLAGIYKPDKKKNLISTFVMRINPDGKPAWFKDVTASVDSIAIGDAHAYLGPLVLTQEGSALVIRSIHATRGDVLNTFVYLNEKGEERLRKKLDNKSFPRALLYAEKSNSFTLVLKGVEQKEKYSSAEPIDMLGINVLGEITWKKENISLTGTLTDVISLSDGYLLAGNYFILSDQTGREIRTKMSSGECSPYIIKLNERGVIIFSKPMVTNGSFYLHRVVKINDMSIQLLGNSETMESGVSGVLKPSEKFLHIMTNKFGQQISTNF
jgi:hypothetical protein